MPLLALLIADFNGVVRPLGAIVSVSVAVMIVARDWRSIEFSSAWRLIAAGLFGIPLGLVVFELVDIRTAKIALAFLILAFSTYSLVRPTTGKPISDRWAWLAGFLAGIIGNAYNTHGPPLVIFGSLRQWPATKMRATLQGYFLPAGAIVVVQHAFYGRYNMELAWMYLAALPAVLLAVVVGRLLNKRLRGRGFERYIHVLLILVAIMLLATSIWS